MILTKDCLIQKFALEIVFKPLGRGGGESNGSHALFKPTDRISWMAKLIEIAIKQL